VLYFASVEFARPPSHQRGEMKGGVNGRGTGAFENLRPRHSDVRFISLPSAVLTLWYSVSFVQSEHVFCRPFVRQSRLKVA
jgi:hypothetical protein